MFEQRLKSSKLHDQKLLNPKEQQKQQNMCLYTYTYGCVYTHTHKEICFKDIAHFVFVCCLLLIRFRCDCSVSAGWSQM